MIAVADAGPLHYLLLIGRIGLLERLFDAILVPSTVVGELSASGAPEAVRLWAASLPAWVRVREPSVDLPPVRRGAGELAAIALARELGLPLLCDDLVARRIATGQGLAVSGTLGVLQRAHARGMDENTDSRRALEATNFRATDDFLDEMERDAQRMRREYRG